MSDDAKLCEELLGEWKQLALARADRVRALRDEVDLLTDELARVADARAEDRRVMRLCADAAVTIAAGLDVVASYLAPTPRASIAKLTDELSRMADAITARVGTASDDAREARS